MPSVGFPSVLDFQDRGAASDGAEPGLSSSQSAKTSVDSVDLLREWSVGVFHRQREEAAGAAFDLVQHVADDAGGSISRTRNTPARMTVIRNHCQVLRIIFVNGKPGIGAAQIEADQGTWTDATVDQGLADTLPLVRPA